MTSSIWGANETEFFYTLTPERILSAVEALDVRCTGRCLALNSMENRVYEIELEEPFPGTPENSSRFVIAKFYRPGRWTAAQIQEEHQFLLDLIDYEIPVVPPLRSPNGESLHTMQPEGIFYSVTPKKGGRNPDELNDGQLEQLGRLIARVHNVGALQPFRYRPRLTAQAYGRENLRFLLEKDFIPPEMEQRFAQVISDICDISEPLLAEFPQQRLHGDCHFGNILWGSDGAFLVDFDDSVSGPCIQDLWLLMNGSHDDTHRKCELLLSGYQQMRDFDRRSLRLIEPLRSLRMIHFMAWIARRWNDPAFQRAFPHFGTGGYWGEQLRDLMEQLSKIQEPEMSDLS